MEQFEFSAEHDREFLATAYWMAIVGRLAMIAGALQAAGGLLRVVTDSPELGGPTLLSGAVYLIIGFFANRVAGSFRAIATSRGQDIDHLMIAVVALKRLFRLITVGIFALLIIALLAGLVIGLLSSGG